MVGGLGIVGGRKEGWENPDSTARNGLGARDNKLTIKEIVDITMKKPIFGFEGYHIKANEVNDLTPVKASLRAKAKRVMFCE